MKHTLTLLTALVITSFKAVHAAEPPLTVIFDTDAGGDCDDIGALFLLHGAVERGEVKLLATMGCTSSKVIGPCLDAVNRWFGRSDIPVGTLKDDGLLPHPGYTAEVVRRLPHGFTESKEYPDAVTLYRQLLARQPDRSVIVGEQKTGLTINSSRKLSHVQMSTRQRHVRAGGNGGLHAASSCGAIQAQHHCHHGR